MEGQRVVVVVEAAEAARAALQWAVRNFLRPGDFIVLLYVYPFSRSRKKQRALRLKGFHLALSFKELCGGVAEGKVEIVVKEGDQVAVILSLLTEIRAAALVLGFHEQSFLYRMAAHNVNLSCRILAVKQEAPRAHAGSVAFEFTQVEIATLCLPQRKKIRYQILPTCAWRQSRRKKTEELCMNCVLP